MTTLASPRWAILFGAVSLAGSACTSAAQHGPDQGNSGTPPTGLDAGGIQGPGAPSPDAGGNSPPLDGAAEGATASNGDAGSADGTTDAAGPASRCDPSHSWQPLGALTTVTA